MRLEEAIQQPKFRSSHERAHINVLYTASFFSQQATRILRPLGISMQQFNLLRILRGMNGQPATIKLLTERMLDKMSNASRLVEKLKQKGLVVRRACADDRRQVDIFITDAGLQLIATATEAMDQAMTDHYVNLDAEEASALSLLLDKFRGEE
ncbi:MAG: MarR family transcriptional regulator [Bacteroidota bacterium]